MTRSRGAQKTLRISRMRSAFLSRGFGPPRQNIPTSPATSRARGVGQGGVCLDPCRMLPSFASIRSFPSHVRRRRFTPILSPFPAMGDRLYRVRRNPRFVAECRAVLCSLLCGTCSLGSPEAASGAVRTGPSREHARFQPGRPRADGASASDTSTTRSFFNGSHRHFTPNGPATCAPSHRGHFGGSGGIWVCG
jgi:hypothetical protein